MHLFRLFYYGIMFKKLYMVYGMLALKNTEMESDSMQNLKDLVNMEKVIMLSGNTFEGVKTGFEQLDSVTGGLADGEVIVLGGRPAMGKTAFACALVDEVGVTQKECVLYFSLDMPSRLVARRLLALHAGVNTVWNDANNEKFRKAVHSASSDMNDVNIFIDDTPVSSVDRIKEKCLELYKKRNIRLVIIDYLQLIKGNEFDSRHEEIESIMRGLKEIALKLSCPVFVLSQLNRKAERRTDHRPMLCDLRDSGVIEDMADEVMLLYRDDYYFLDSEDKGKAELKVFKCSRASVSTLIINYDMSKGQFKN